MVWNDIWAVSFGISFIITDNPDGTIYGLVRGDIPDSQPRSSSNDSWRVQLSFSCPQQQVDRPNFRSDDGLWPGRKRRTRTGRRHLERVKVRGAHAGAGASQMRSALHFNGPSLVSESASACDVGQVFAGVHRFCCGPLFHRIPGVR
jgi:hypothetical protein